MKPALRKSTRITRTHLAVQEERLVMDLLRLHRAGSNLAVISAKLHELRAVRAQMSQAQDAHGPRRLPLATWGTVAYHTPSGWHKL